MRPLDQFIQVAGHRTRYWQVGTVGSVVILVHGISCSVAEWEHSIHALGAQHRVFALDLLGHGLTDKPAEAVDDMPMYGQFILAFMDALGLAQVSIVGNSMGGRLAIECAAQAPQRVQSMVLSAPAGIDSSCLLEFRLATLPIVGELLTYPHALGLGMLWRKAFVDASTVTKSFVAEKVLLAKQAGAGVAFMRTLRGWLNVGGFKAHRLQEAHLQMQQIKQPTLVIWGRQDQFLPVAHLDTLKRLMPHAETVVLDPCGHAPMLETPAKFNRLVLDFLAK